MSQSASKRTLESPEAALAQSKMSSTDAGKLDLVLRKLESLEVSMKQSNDRTARIETELLALRRENDFLRAELRKASSMAFNHTMVLSRLRYQAIKEGQATRRANVRLYNRPLGEVDESDPPRGAKISAEKFIRENIGDKFAKGVVRAYRTNRTDTSKALVVEFNSSDLAQEALKISREKKLDDMKSDLSSEHLGLRKQLGFHKLALISLGRKVEMKSDFLVVDGVIKTVDINGSLIERASLWLGPPPVQHVGWQSSTPLLSVPTEFQGLSGPSSSQ